MIKKLVCIGLLTIAVVFLNGCVQEKVSNKPAETINQSTQHIKPNRVELGNFGYSYYSQTIRDFQNKSEISWDVILNEDGLVYRRPNTTVVFQDFIDQKKFEMTDFSGIRSRFDMATKYKDKYDYGVFLLLEEVFHPVIRVEWGWSNISSWKIEGSDSFEGVQVKLFKTWYIEKYKTWDQKWWNTIVSTNNYNDPIVRKWSEEYGYDLYKAWNKHMENLSKKSAIIGLSGLISDPFSNEFEYYYPSPLREYVLSNYDLLFTYMDPINSSEIAESENQVKGLRKKFNYRGKIAHILTSSFRNNLKWNETVAFKEFKSVHPYVDVIMVYPYAEEWNNPHIPYPPELINFSRRFSEKNRLKK